MKVVVEQDVEGNFPRVVTENGKPRVRTESFRFAAADEPQEMPDDIAEHLIGLKYAHKPGSRASRSSD